MAAVSSCYAAWYCGQQQPRPSTSSQQIVHRAPTTLALPVSHFSKDISRVGSSRSRRKSRRKSYSRCSSNDSGPTTSYDSVRPDNDRAVVSAENGRGRKLLLHERRNGQLVTRYWADEQSLAVSKEDTDTSDSESIAGKSLEVQESLGLPIRVPQYLRTFVLPSGFPDTVSDDYLTYMLWQFPTNVTGWICSTLVTSSLLKAIGIGGGGGSAAAASAAIKWVSKDGLGSVGRLFIGGRFGSLFDEDPKQWRMYADFIGSAGSIFELATPLAPGSFLLLASLGNLTKAVAKGLKDPSFRVIQNHFAVSENVGDVVAKEEVWGVAAQLVGLGLGVLLLGSPGISSSYWELVTTWVSIRALHLWLRYQTLAVLRIDTINYKRAVILIEDFISGSRIPGCDECNVKEQILVPRTLLDPRVRFGLKLEELLGSQPAADEVRQLLKVYEQENYLLVLHPNSIHGFEARVVLKEGANNTTLLRSLYQACWLLRQIRQPVPEFEQNPRTSSFLNSVKNGFRGTSFGEQVEILSVSVGEMQEKYGSFVDAIGEQGWSVSRVVLKIPSTASFLVNMQIEE
ncbi:hypothetical protein M758_12G031100 [Ceratodon purpureus]|nr:hypothetical protein M758_12G031100 [Ceratodon purpureus]